MSSTTNVVATLASFGATAVSGVTAFVKQAKKAEDRINALAVRYEAILNSVLKEITKLEATVNKALPAPAPAAQKAPAKKTPAKKQATQKSNQNKRSR